MSLHRFLRRGGGSSSELLDMDSGAQSVHAAILNHQELVTVPVPRREPEEGYEGKRCFRCCKVEPNGHAVGNNRKTWICNKCNAFEARLKRLTAGTQAAQMWRDMSNEELVQCRAECNELGTEALKANLTAFFTQKQIKESMVHAAGEAEYLPLSVYKTKGYDKTWVDWIKATQPRREPAPGMFTYALTIDKEGWKKKEKEIQDSGCIDLCMLPVLFSKHDDDDDDDDDARGAEARCHALASSGLWL